VPHARCYPRRRFLGLLKLISGVAPYLLLQIGKRARDDLKKFSSAFLVELESLACLLFGLPII
jgi:hypothetical protein